MRSFRAGLAIAFLAMGLMGIVVFRVQSTSAETQIVYSLPASSVQALERAEWESPESDLKTERSKVLSGMEASF
mgnify:CR=1 FL=1